MRALRIEKALYGVALVRFDLPESKVNVLSSALLDEFTSVLDTIGSDPSFRASVLISDKPDNFIAGADLDELRGIETSGQASEFAKNGHMILDRIANADKPMVAAIHGAALGGGLEVALACSYRIATRHPKTVLGLPEVMVGLLPGGGGTQRLPRLIGLVRALPMLLAGQKLRGKKALEVGLVDALTTPDRLEDEAVEAAASLADGSIKSKKKSVAVRVQNRSPMRTLIISRARQDVRRRTRGLYPAPRAILECVETGLRDGFEKGRQREIERFGELVVSPEAKNLIWLFGAMNDSKKLSDEAEPRQVRKLAGLGGGLMGEGIASVSLPLADVVVKDVSAGQLERVRERIDASIWKRLASGSLTTNEADLQRRRLTTTTHRSSIAGADLVIEAVFEDLSLKRNVLAQTEEMIDEGAVFASNTSAISIGEIAKNAAHPERVLGMHYFSPVPRMPLLEIIVRPDTADWAEATARKFGADQGKTIIVVRDGPGFYTTRILAPFINEAVVLLEKGAEIRALDSALKDFGFPVGPVTLLDEVGIDVAAHVAVDLGQAFESRGLGASSVLPMLIEAGFGGRKNKKGFFVYDAGKGPKPVNEEIYAFFGGSERKQLDKREMADRLALLMVNEAVHCLSEGVLSSARDGDLGAILGLGFPPFRGGPFHFVDSEGADVVVDRLRELRELHGPRFEPATMLVAMAKNGERFY